MDKLRYNTIRKMDISNGKGIGCSIFFQGCSHHCFNCFNTETWSFDNGKILTSCDMKELEELCNKSYIEFVSFLGGEPFDQPLDKLYLFIKTLKNNVNKPFYLWSGYTFKQIQSDPNKAKILPYLDYIIDGEYIDELKDYTLKLRGSSNQRIWKKGENNKWQDVTLQID